MPQRETHRNDGLELLTLTRFATKSIMLKSSTNLRSMINEIFCYSKLVVEYCTKLAQMTVNKCYGDQMTESNPKIVQTLLLQPKIAGG